MLRSVPAAHASLAQASNTTGERCLKTLETSPSSWIYAAIAVTLAMVFAIDLLTPMRVAIWVFYLLPVVLCVGANRSSVPIFTAGAATALMIAGYLLAR